MNVLEAISSRRSVRKYVIGAPVKDDDIKAMLTAAMEAPSACNMRPWEFVVVTSEEYKNKLADTMKYAPHARTAGAVIVVCGLPKIQEGTIGEGFWPQDCGAAIENILLSAKGLGYGTCWCGVYPNQEAVKKLQNILNVESTPLGLITVGVAAEEPAKRGKFEESKVKYL